MSLHASVSPSSGMSLNLEMNLSRPLPQMQHALTPVRPQPGNTPVILPFHNVKDPPDLDPFLHSDQSFSVATEAYKNALQALRLTLSVAELAFVQSIVSIEKLHDVATEAQRICARRKEKGRLQSLIEILDHYSPILDVLSQFHADYAVLFWGTIKWLLQVGMNYYKLLRRLSSMLEEIGDNLPRFMLYERILPTNHMRQVISKLYAAIIQFLHEAIAFWKARTSRKLLVAFWTPFETKFSDTVDKIHRLQKCAEKDAIATEMAQRRRDSFRLENQIWELTLVNRHMSQTILEIKQGQTILLLITIRQHLFASFECKSEYQEDFTKVYTAFVSAEWHETMRKEAQFSQWQHVSYSRLTYIQAEGLEPMITVGQQLYDSRHSSRVRRVTLFWGDGMTKESALAALIYGVLNKHAEKLLYREAGSYYADKFSRCSPSFDDLWIIFGEMMSLLPELHCTVHVASYEPQATEFVAKLVAFALQPRDGKFDLHVYHPTVNALSSTPGWAELDNDYDVDYDLNVYDSLFRLVLLEANYYDNISTTMRKYLWMTPWRVLRYNLMSFAYHQTCHIIRPEVRQHDGKRPLPSFCYESLEHQQAASLLKRGVIAFFQFIPMDMPNEIQQQIRDTFYVSDRQATQPERIPGSSVQLFKTEAKRQPVPLESEQRSDIWVAIQAQFEVIISELLEQKILDVLKQSGHGGATHIEKMDLVGRRVFSREQWTISELLQARERLEAVLVNAAITGLMATQQMVFPLGPRMGHLIT